MSSVVVIKPVVTQAIFDLDLSMIKTKLCDEKEGRGWSREKADEVEILYKRYLVLCLKYPRLSIVPTKDIDAFWHQHILDTRAYAKDCNRIFGYFLHHFPYLGMRGLEDVLKLKRAFENTKKLFKQEFGEALPAPANCSDCDSSACDDPPSCGSSCTGISTTHQSPTIF